MAIAAATLFIEPISVANSTQSDSKNDDNINNNNILNKNDSPISSESLSVANSRTPDSVTNDIEMDVLSKNNDINENSISISNSISNSNCRYCYRNISPKLNFSQCYCSGILCKQCLINEIMLTHSRDNNNSLQCTVCNKKYDITPSFFFNPSRDCSSFFLNNLIHCGLKQETYLLDSVTGTIGFYLVIIGITTWILSTSLLFAFPPYGCPIELYYMVSIFDIAVGISTLWFIIKCRYLSSLILSIFYCARFIYILLGWIPNINLCNIYKYHQIEHNHVFVLSYFVGFSLISSIIMHCCWLIDLRSQYTKYKKDNSKLNLIINGINIEINVTNYMEINDNEQDDY